MPETLALSSRRQLEEDALYLGVLTAWQVKPLSRLEYPVETPILNLLREWGLTFAPVTRFAQDGTRCHHLAFSVQPALLAAYCAEFDGTRLEETPAVIWAEAHYFGYPPCCAESFIRAPHAPNDLTVEEQGLLFHHACPGCRVTPALIPRYRAALAVAQQQHQRLELYTGAAA